MSFDWTEFLTLAEALQSDPNSPGPPEATLRSAASRAYYAAFNCALGFACREGFVPKKSGFDHQRIQTYFTTFKPPDPTRGKIGKELNRLCDHRRRADYEDTLGKRPDSLACHAVGMAKRVIENLRSLSLPDGDSQ